MVTEKTFQEIQAPVSFNDTEHAFAYKSDAELRQAHFLFSSMGNSFLLNLSLKLMPLLVKIRFPFTRMLVRNTIFRQFVGGESLQQSIPAVNKLALFNVHTILDYGVEGKEGSESDYDKAASHFAEVIDFASAHKHIPCISIKMTGVMSNRLLEKMHELMQEPKGSLPEKYDAALKKISVSELDAWQKAMGRMEMICKKGKDSGVAVWVDAEESWMQDPMDMASMLLMEKFNKERAIVFNTFQMYRHDRLSFLKESHCYAINQGFILGAKLVRGAYMEKERERAKRMGYASPIQPDKESSDRDFDAAVRFCIENIDSISMVLGTHNEKSSLLGAELMLQRGLSPSHAHVQFSQLLGMSDNITFNLAARGFNAGKYVPFGPIDDVIPYLMRRAKENSSVKGQTGRELSLIKKELNRRKAVK